MTQMPRLQNRDYTVGWICALQVEFTASKAMLDSEHPPLSQDNDDHNSYKLGRIGGHNIVMACLPSGESGTASAASVLNDMKRSFKLLRFCLMVGIGGAVPDTPKDIRLGDIMVSNPGMNSGGVIQYDAGKVEQAGIFVQMGTLNMPPKNLRTAIANLQSDHDIYTPMFPKHLDDVLKKHERMRLKYSRPSPETDILFNSCYDHPTDEQDCSQCKPAERKPRKAIVSEPRVHLGLIASANRIMKHGATRDDLWKKYGIECFETEAAGLMNSFHCLVIRGISDYADSHKNDLWQPYAAAIAAAYVKELLSVIATENIDKMAPIDGATDESEPKVHHTTPGTMTLSTYRHQLPSTSLNPNIWYFLKSYNSPTTNIDVDDTSEKLPHDVQITLSLEDPRRLSQYWKIVPNRLVGYWTLSNRAYPDLSLDVYGDNKGHPHLATSAFVTGQQWQVVERDDGAVSLYNNYSGSDMYLCSIDNLNIPRRLMVYPRDDRNKSQLFRLCGAGNIEPQPRSQNRAITYTPDDQISIETILGPESSRSENLPYEHQKTTVKYLTSVWNKVFRW